MITQIPTETDFLSPGTDFLNLAWDATVRLSVEMTKAQEATGLDDEDLNKEDYLRKSQRILATSLALAQQGAELCLKACIARVSPFLLIRDEPRKWPKSDAPYHQLATIDAQDLVTVYRATVGTLSADFVGEFDRIRRVRNTIFHSTGHSDQLQEVEILTWILRVIKELKPELRWLTLRSAYIRNSPQEHIYEYVDGSDYVDLQLADEFLTVLDILPPSACRDLLGVSSKKARFYECPVCRWPDTDRQYKIAQLRPQTASSETLYCYICSADFQVSRNRCTVRRCKGNVIFSDDNRCLTCGSEVGS